MESKFVKVFGLVSLGLGVLLVLNGFFITPGFIASHFSPSDILLEKAIEGIRLFRLSTICLGAIAALFGALNLTCPSRVNRFFDSVSRLGERFQSRCFYLPFCFACFLIALGLGLLITQSGSGISPDSTAYITVGENVYYGNGFLTIGGGQHTNQPPLYPLSIATFMHFGFDAEQAARLVPILCFASLMFPLFFLGRMISSVFTGYVGCLMCLVFTPLLRVTSYAWSEMPYIFFSVLAILFLTKFGEGNEAKNKMLCVSGFFTALVILTRYIGVTLLLVGLIVIVLNNKSRLKKMVYQISLFGSISGLPMIPWLYRNIALTSYLSGSIREESTMGLLANVNRTVVTIVNDYFAGPLSQWLLSHLPSYGYIGLAIIIATCFVLLVVYVKTHSTDKRVWLKYLRKNYVVILYIFVYLTTLIIIRSIWHFDQIGSRLTSPPYPFLILVVISCIFYASRQIRKPSLKPTLFLIITILCALFLAFQASSSLFFYEWAKDGQGYNSPFWRNSQTIAWVESNVPDSATVYSNRADAVQFRLKRLARYLPHSESEKEIDEFFKKLTIEESSFIIGFKEAGRSDLLSNSEIAEMNQKYHVLLVVADFPESTIWRVQH